MVTDIKNDVDEVAASYPNIDVRSAEWDGGQLKLNIGLKGGPQVAPLPDNVTLISSAEEEVPTAETIGSLSPLGRESAGLRTIDLDPLTRDYLDLAQPSVVTSDPRTLYQRSIDYYKSKDVYGTTINVLTNFAAKGFENDIDDPTIKNFYDNWGVDVGFDSLVEKIFFDFFRVGIVRTYKIMGKYEPKVNYVSPIPAQVPKKVNKKAEARRGNRYTKAQIPTAYTILNPTVLELRGNLLFGPPATFIKASAGKEFKELLEMDRRNLSVFQKNIIKNLPAAFKKAVKNGDDIPLDPELVGEVDYRRMPYERYPVPRGARSFEALEFKDELRKADYSTLDGITNYILKITVGNDKFPINSQEALERVGEMFETVSKSYKVVWNHTLNVEKITSPEIGEILGEGKYKQVNGDITGSLGLIRALLDGLGESSTAATELAVKAVIEEINYARRQVQRWIYAEYAVVAKAMGFDRFPRVRFDDMALRDELAMMTLIHGMIDRRIISYRTGQKKLGFDPDTELAQMQAEKELVMAGDLGILGSPFQQSADSVQPVQRTPSGTPSEGRPKGKPAKTPKDKDKTKPPAVSKAALVSAALQQLSLDDLEGFLETVMRMKTKDKQSSD